MPGHEFHAESLSLLWVIPFVGILLSIAIMPLTVPHFWHRHFGKVSLFWALSFIIPFTIQFGYQPALSESLHVLLLDYVPFLVLLYALYTISGGIHIAGELAGSTLSNICILALGSVLAGVMGTTGAAMLLVRPLLSANHRRQHKIHTFVFFIFLVANIGGGLTPLGDPPLFLGFLRGVSFFWPTLHLWQPMLFLIVLLLIIYTFIDLYFLRKEKNMAVMPVPVPVEPTATKAKAKITIEGKINFLFLIGVVLSVLMSGVWKPHIHFNLYYVHLELQNIMRDAFLIGLAMCSLRYTRSENRVRNQFNWEPILEVAKLFFGIFITIIPAIAILKTGEEGALKALIDIAFSDGKPWNAGFFWLTGILSSFLDNAPTYLVFFNLASGDPELLMGPLSKTLMAISSGAVFMGAMTYIGNAPNFMVRSIAVNSGVKMPSFFGYMGWSFIILVPCFYLVEILFIG